MLDLYNMSVGVFSKKREYLKISSQCLFPGPRMFPGPRLVILSCCFDFCLFLLYWCHTFFLIHHVYVSQPPKKCKLKVSIWGNFVIFYYWSVWGNLNLVSIGFVSQTFVSNIWNIGMVQIGISSKEINAASWKTLMNFEIYIF